MGADGAGAAEDLQDDEVDVDGVGVGFTAVEGEERDKHGELEAGVDVADVGRRAVDEEPVGEECGEPLRVQADADADAVDVTVAFEAAAGGVIFLSSRDCAGRGELKASEEEKGEERVTGYHGKGVTGTERAIVVFGH